MVKRFSAVAAFLCLFLTTPPFAHAAPALLALVPTLAATAGTPDSAQSTFAANVASIIADNSSAVTLTAAINDSSGNPVSGQMVTLTASGTGNTFGQASGKTDSSGLFTTTLRSSKAEVKALTATAGSVALNANVTFRAGPPSSTTTKLLANPNTNVVADNNTTTTLSTTVLDSQRNPVANAQVQLAVSGSNNTIGNSNATSDANGVFSTTLKSGHSEVKRVTLTTGGVTSNTNVTFVAGAPNGNNTTFVLAPNGNVVADNKTNLLVTITAKDALGNLVPNSTVTVAAGGANNTLGASTGSTNSQGVFNTTLHSGKAELKALTLGVGGITHNANVLFVPGPPKAPNTFVVASPNSAVADANTTVAITATVLDGTNNPVSGQAITLAVSGSNNVINVASGSSDGNGVFRSSFASSKAESKTVTVKAGTAIVSTNVLVTPGSPNLTTSTFVASPNRTIVANDASIVTLTATLRDVKGNPVPNQGLSLTSSGNDNTFSVANGNTNASGVFSSNLRSGVAQTKHVTLSGALTGSANVVFVAGGPDATQSTFTASPNANLLANNDANTTLAARLFDAQHNPVIGQNVTLSASGTNNIFASKTGATDANGAFSTTLKTSRAETKAVSLTAGNASLKTNVGFVAGSPNATTSSFEVTPPSVVANGSATAKLTGIVKDAFGNGVPNQNVTIAITGGNATLAASTGNTNDSGAFSTTLTAVRAGTKTLSFTAGSVVLSANAVFVAGSPNVAASTFTVDSNAAKVADNTAVFTYTATLHDGQNNPVINQSVTISSSGTGNVFSKLSGATDANGAFVSTLRTTKAEAKVVTLKAGAASLSQSSNFIPGSPNQKATTLVVSPTSAPADGTTTVAVLASVRDAFKNDIANQNVGLAVSGSNNTLASSGGNTDATGNFNTTLKSTRAEAKVVTLSVGGFTLSSNAIFEPGTPTSAHSVLTASPNSLTANNNDKVTLAAAFVDAIGNPVPKLRVAVVATGSGNKLGASGGSTDANGTFTTTLASSMAEAKHVTVAAGGLTLGANVTFVHGAPSAATSTVAINPNVGVVADNNTTAAVKVTVLDAQKNPVPTQAVTLAATNSNATLGAQNGNVDANGLLSTTIKCRSSGVQRITVTAAGVTFSGNVTFVAGLPSAHNTTLVAAPDANIVANGAASSTLTFTVGDALGNPVVAQAVSLSSDGNNSSLGVSSGKTDLAGKFVTTLKSTVAQHKTVTATAGSVTQSANVTFVVGPPANGTTTLTASPNTVAANNSNQSTLVATVKDAKGNLISGQAVSLASSGNNNVFGATSGTTDGNATFTTTLKSGHAETKTVVLTAGPALVKASLTFTAGSPNQAGSTLVVTPNSVVANNTATASLTAKIVDAFGNPVPNQSVTLASTGTGNTLEASSGTTNAAGTVVTTLKSSVAETKALTVTAGNVTLHQNVTFVPGAPSVAQSSLTLSPNTGLLANNNDRTTLTAAVRDAYNNVIHNTNVVVSSSGSKNVFSATTGATDANGSFTTTLLTSKAEQKTVTLQVLNVSLKANVTFGAGSPNATQSSVSIAPATAVADNTTTVNVSVTAKDALGNPINGQGIALAVNGNNNTLGQSGGNATAQGSFTTTLKSATAQAKVVTATLGGTTVTGNVTFLPGAASAANSTFVASPNSILADNANTAAFAAHVHDALGNPLGNTKVTVSITGTGAAASPSSGVTDANGNFNVTVKGTKAEAKVVALKIGSVSLNANLILRTGSPNATTSTLVVAPKSATANGVDVATVTATVRDAFGNLVANQNVSLSCSGGNNVLAASGGNTSAAGEFSTTLKSTNAQVKVVTLTGGGMTLSANVTFEAGSPNGTLSTLSLTPNTQLANNTNTVALTASLLDNYGNAVPNQSIALSANGTMNTFTPPSGKTNASGGFTSTLRSSKAEAKAVTMTAGTLTKTAAVTFQVGPPSRSTSSLTASPNGKVVADNNTTVTLTATVKDGTGNLLGTYPVTLASSGTHSTLASAGGNTATDGTFTTTLKTNTAETKVVTLTAGSMSLTQNVTFIAGSPNSHASTFVASPNANVTADGKTGAALTASLVDDFNNPVAGLAVSLNANGTGNSFTTASGSTSQAGLFTSNLRSTVAQSQTVTLHAGNINIAIPVAFVPGAPSTTKSLVVLSPNQVNADSNTNIAVTVSVRDAFDNVVPSKTYTLAVSGSNNTIASGGASGTANANGVITTSFSSTHAEDKRVSVVVSGVTLSATAKVLAGSPNATASTLVASPNTNVAADYSSTSTYTATLVDVHNNPIVNQAVTLNSNDTGASLSATGGNTTSAGQFVARLKSSTAGVKQVTFRAGALTLSANVTFVAGAPVTASTNLSASPRVGVAANGTSTVALTATVGDKLDNPVASTPVTLTSSIGSDTLTPSSGSTDANGVFTATVKATVGGTRTITLKAGAATASATVVFSGGTALVWPAAEQVRLAAGDDTPATLRPAQLAVADLDGDGALDMVTVTPESGTLQVALGDGHGGFGEAQAQPTGGMPVAVTTGDVDGDGLVDVLVADARAGTLSAWLGRGDGSLAAPLVLAALDRPTALAGGDFAGDGRLHVAVADGEDGEVTVLRNGGGLAFVAGEAVWARGAISSLRAQDVDGDAVADLLITSDEAQSVELFVGRTERGLDPVGRQLAVAGLYGAVTGDFDGDGTVDLAAHRAADGALTVLWGQPDGSFVTGALHRGVGLPLLAADLDGDGRDDLVSRAPGGELKVRLSGRSFAPVAAR